MKKKTIRKIINRKFDHFLKFIEDEETKDLIDQNSLISGGCITSMLLNEDINDFDLYFTNLETAQAVAQYFANKFSENLPEGSIKPEVINKDGRIKIVCRSAGVVSNSGTEGYEYFEQVDPDKAVDYIERTLEPNGGKLYDPILITSNAITLKGDIQLIIRFYGEPEEIHKNYDFVHCTNYWLSRDREVYLNKDALESTLTKELKYVGSRYPIASIIRLRKFIKRGWSINAGQIVKMAWQIGELDLKNPEILEDQLMGVDFAYFCEVINKLKQKDGTIDKTYLFQIIDECFDMDLEAN